MPMLVDWERNVLDEDGMLNYFSYREKMEKFYPLMQKAHDTHQKQHLEIKVKGRTYEFIVDKDGTGCLRKKIIKSWW